MRELKFRAFIKKDKRMSEVYNLCWSGGLEISLQFKSKNLYEDLDDSECILMQYTNIKDKNGKEIYEGDVVNMVSKKGVSISRRVVFYNGSFRLIKSKKGRNSAKKNLFAQKVYKAKLEVIGNIYETPELVK